MKYTKSQFKQEYYRLWESGLLLPISQNASVYSVKYRKNELDQYSRVTLKATSVSDALERACYAITYASPWRPEDIDLHAVYDEEENILWIDEPFYNLIQKKNEFRGMDRRSFLAAFGATSAAILFGLRPRSVNAATTSVAVSGTLSGFSGEQLYTSPGSYNWSVTSPLTVSVVCVGGGGGYCPVNWYGAGDGGSLIYKNSISVGAGTVPVVVGVGGGSRQKGQDSSFNGSLIAYGGGYSGTNGESSISPTGSGNGSGGDGGGTGGLGGQYGGGGGAGGYTGNGGNRGVFSGSAGSGGGGAGGFGDGIDGGGSGGGGVGIYGLGSSGSSTGLGGSGGTSSPLFEGSGGGSYGGGSGVEMDGGGGGGGSGAVRIIWGSGRSFPNNAS